MNPRRCYPQWFSRPPLSAAQPSLRTMSGDDTAKAEKLSTASLPERPESTLLRSFKEGGPESAAKTLFARYNKEKKNIDFFLEGQIFSF